MCPKPMSLLELNFTEKFPVASGTLKVSFFRHHQARKLFKTAQFLCNGVLQPKLTPEN